MDSNTCLAHPFAGSHAVPTIYPIYIYLKQRYLWRPLNDNECKTSRNFDWRNKRTKQNSKLSFSSCPSSHSPPADLFWQIVRPSDASKNFAHCICTRRSFLSRRTRRRIHSVCTCVHILHMLSQYTILHYIVYYINLYKLFNLICLSICPSICQSVSPSGECSSLCHPETPRRNNVSSPPSKHLCPTHTHTQTNTH